MASGTLGQADLAATTNTAVYTVPAGKVASFNVNVLNRTTSNVTVRMAISATSSPTNSEFLEYEATVPANGVMERTGLVASAGKNLVIYASSTGVSVNVFGFEE
ncbi:hypothetical protein [Limnohabitans radicicola]|uniref:Uncharacterized protein n=1 Tax=Limnohabitans radicicola TaxID=2771427 RepID=A0A927IN12_9BURK|nr:hypothetical protein [Limnohabitans radicicola]MBD8051756.1 hypothetical protein [Limnohabitans radicicola]